MKSILGRRRNILLVAVVLAAVMPAARGDGLEDFKLVKAIPADAFLAVNSRDHAGKEFITKQWARVWAEVERVRFDRDLKRMFKGMLKQDLPPGTEPEGFEEQWQQIHDLLSSVEWSSLGKREFAAGVKLGFPTVEFVLLMMPPEDKLQGNFDGLTGMLKTLTEFDPNTIKLTTEEDGGTVVHRVGFVGAPLPLVLTLARHNDVIVIGFGPTMVEQTLALLRGEGGQALASTERFKEAFTKLPPPTDELSFVDLAKLFGQVRQMVAGFMEMAEAAAPAEGEPGHEDYVKGKALPGKIIDALDMWEYQAAVKTTDGMLATTDSVTVLRDDAESRALYAVLYGNQPLSDPLKYVPASAGDFLATSGIDLPALYKVVVKIIREDVPDGEEIVAKLESVKLGGAPKTVTPTEEGTPPEEGTPAEAGTPSEEVAPAEAGLDIENDIIGWIGGSLTTFSVPGKTPYSPSEFVLMLSVRDEEKARTLIDRLTGMIKPMLASQNGSVVDAEIKGAEGFKSVIFPMLAMMGMSKPTLGVKDGWLFFGSSPEMIQTALTVGAGEAENFSTNERFRKEGIQPEGSVTSLSFTDKTKMGEQLGQALQMVPMVGMMVPDLMKNPVAQGAISMVGKAGRVVKKLDFFQSSASRKTFDGKTEVAKCITTYREPPVITKPKPPEAETESAEPGEEGESKVIDE